MIDRGKHDSKQDLLAEIQQLTSELQSARKESANYRKIILSMMPREEYEITEEDLKAIVAKSDLKSLINEIARPVERSVAKRNKTRTRKAKMSASA